LHDGNSAAKDISKHLLYPFVYQNAAKYTLTIIPCETGLMPNQSTFKKDKELKVNFDSKSA